MFPIFQIQLLQRPRRYLRQPILIQPPNKMFLLPHLPFNISIQLIIQPIPTLCLLRLRLVVFLLHCRFGIVETVLLAHSIFDLLHQLIVIYFVTAIKGFPDLLVDNEILKTWIEVQLAHTLFHLLHTEQRSSEEVDQLLGSGIVNRVEVVVFLWSW